MPVLSMTLSQRGWREELLWVLGFEPLTRGTTYGWVMCVSSLEGQPYAGNFRGTGSRRHVNRKMKSSRAYWEFSVDDHGEKDLRAMVIGESLRLLTPATRSQQCCTQRWQSRNRNRGSPTATYLTGVWRRRAILGAKEGRLVHQSQ